MRIISGGLINSRCTSVVFTKAAFIAALMIISAEIAEAAAQTI